MIKQFVQACNHTNWTFFSVVFFLCLSLFVLIYCLHQRTMIRRPLQLKVCMCTSDTRTIYPFLYLLLYQVVLTLLTNTMKAMGTYIINVLSAFQRFLIIVITTIIITTTIVIILLILFCFHKAPQTTIKCRLRALANCKHTHVPYIAHYIEHL